MQISRQYFLANEKVNQTELLDNVRMRE